MLLPFSPPLICISIYSFIFTEVLQAAAVDIWNFQMLINIQICWFYMVRLKQIAEKRIMTPWIKKKVSTQSHKCSHIGKIVCAHMENDSRKPACMSTSCLPAEGEISCFCVTFLFTGKPCTYTVSFLPIVRITQESVVQLFVPLVCSLLDKHTPKAID